MLKCTGNDVVLVSLKILFILFIFQWPYIIVGILGLILTGILSLITAFLFFGRNSFKEEERNLLDEVKFRGYIPELTASKTCLSDGHDYYTVTGSTLIDDLIHEILENIINDFIDPWYTYLSSERTFQNSIKRCACRTIKNLSIRLKRVDWVLLLTRQVVDDVASHIRLFRLAKEKIEVEKEINPSKKNDLESVFFDLEVEMEVRYCRDLISTSPAYESACLHDLTDLLLYMLMPSEDFRSRPLRFLLREILINRVILPVLSKICCPEFLNQCILVLLSEVRISTDDFVLIIQNCESIQDLEAILESAQEQMNLLTTMDYNKTIESIRKEVQALNDLTSMLKKRMKDLEAEHESPQKVQLPSNDVDADIIQLPITLILTNHIAVSYFSDYLATIHEQDYLDCYMAIEGFNNSVEHQLRAIACGALSDPDLRETMNDAALFLYHQYLSNSAPNRIPLDQSFVDRFLVRMRNDEPSDSWFDHIQKKLVEILTSDRRLYPAFKKSPLYKEMLVALGITDNGIVPPLHDESHGSRLTVEVGMLGVGKNQKANGEFYAVYNVRARRCNGKGEVLSSWNVIRRYSDFHNFNSVLQQKYPKIGSMEFPAKKAFNNLKAKFLEKRCESLNKYLNLVTEPTVLEANLGLECDLLDFLSQQKYVGISQALPKKIVNAMFNPLMDKVKALKTAVTQVPDQVSKMGTEINKAATSIMRNNSGLKRSEVDFQRVAATLDLERDDESIPLRVMLLFANELFSFDARNQWFRSRVIAALRHFLNAAFGSSLNRQIVDFVRTQTDEQHIAHWLTLLRSSLNPKTEKKHTKNNNSGPLARIMAQVLMMSAIPSELRFVVGTQMSQAAVFNVSQVIQQQTLNRRLCYVLFERLLVTLFPEGKFQQILCTLHSKSPRAAH